MECALAVRGQEARSDEALQVMAQCRRGQRDVGLDVPCGAASVTCLHHKAQDAQAHGVSQRAELLGVSFELGGHATASNIFEVARKLVRARCVPVAGATCGDQPSCA